LKSKKSISRGRGGGGEVQQKQRYNMTLLLWDCRKESIHSNRLSTYAKAAVTVIGVLKNVWWWITE